MRIAPTVAIESWLMAARPRVMTGRGSFRYARSVTVYFHGRQVCDLLGAPPKLDSKLATRRSEGQALDASSADPCYVQNTSHSSWQVPSSGVTGACL